MKLEVAIGDSQKRATELEGRIEVPFDREERYQELTRRQEEIEEKLDLTKNQAMSQMDTAVSENQTNAERHTTKCEPTIKRRTGIRV